MDPQFLKGRILNTDHYDRYYTAVSSRNCKESSLALTVGPFCSSVGLGLKNALRRDPSRGSIKTCIQIRIYFLSFALGPFFRRGGRYGRRAGR